MALQGTDNAAAADRAGGIAGAASRFAKRQIHQGLARRGLALHRLGDGEDEQRRGRLMQHLDINLLLDVGANAGQYAQQARAGGYSGRIVSFEPLPDAYAELSRALAADPKWEARQLALGDEDGESVINVAGNSWSSSLLPMGDRHLSSAPESAYVATERIRTARLDSIWEELTDDSSRVWLKLDVQGFEAHVLRGAEASLPKIQAVQAELALVPLYEGESHWRTLTDELEQRGFSLAGLEAGFSDPVSGRLLQFDGIFAREEGEAADL